MGADRPQSGEGRNGAGDPVGAALAQRLEDRDPTLLRSLYEQYIDRLYAYLVVTLRDHHEAEDAAHETLIVATLSDRYDPARASFDAWLFGIARNIARDLLKSNRRTRPESLDEIAARLDATVGPTSGSDREWLSDDGLVAVFNTLSLPQRQVLVLRYAADLPTKEIAVVLDRSWDWVRKTEQRALRALRERLELTRTAANGHRSAARIGGVERQSMVRLARTPVVSAKRQLALDWSL